ncbi:MAG: hypothetical protein J0M04_20275 [Verrucomicrobia bacterium]|nr:hypothetical protein [Verrucomicrobiota bacterium]
MRTLKAFLCFALSTIPLGADALSSADREALLENLEKIRGTVTDRVDSRYRLAIAAYRAAMVDQEEALAFYLKCTEKVNFLDVGRKPADFREWKKREDERMEETAMRRALMHQLRWLVLTLRASSEKADMVQLADEGKEAIDALYQDKQTLLTQRQIVGQSVLGTVFAKAYEIEGVKTDKWPTSPLDVASFYENIVFPKYRTTGDTKSLRAAWIHRIQLESERRESAPARPTRGNGREGMAPPDPSEAQERFQNEVLPELQWQMELDLFRCGDQRGAAPRMIAHLEKHITHPKAKDWSDQLRTLLSAKPETTPAPTTGDTAGTVQQP